MTEQWRPDAPTVRMCTLAYRAWKDEHGISMESGDVQWVVMATLPHPLELVLLLSIAVPRNVAQRPHHIKVRALDPDRDPIGPDPLATWISDVDMQPDLDIDEDVNLVAVVVLHNLIVERWGRIFFHAIYDDELVAVVGLTVRPDFPVESTAR
jgi:hypothetical protein